MIEVLVKFFQDVHNGRLDEAMRLGTRRPAALIDDLAEALNVDISADRDTMEMALRHALKENV